MIFSSPKQTGKYIHKNNVERETEERERERETEERERERERDLVVLPDLLWFTSPQRVARPLRGMSV